MRRPPKPKGSRHYSLLTQTSGAATLRAMPRISPKARARRFLLGIKGADIVTFHGSPVFSDDVLDRLAEVIADAQDEVREGFLRKPRGREQTIHD